MKKIIIISLIAFLASGLSSYAQDGNLYLQKSQMTFSYQMGFPTSDLKDFIPENDFLGWDYEMKTMVTHNLAVGGHIGYQGFYKKYPRATYEFPQGAITTTIFKYYYTLPLQAIATWYFMPEGMVQPFVGMNLGINYNERRGEIGIGVLLRGRHLPHEDHDAREQCDGNRQYEDVRDDIRDTLLAVTQLALELTHP